MGTEYRSAYNHNSIDNVATLARSSLLIRQKAKREKVSLQISYDSLVTSMKGHNFQFVLYILFCPDPRYHQSSMPISLKKQH